MSQRTIQPQPDARASTPRRVKVIDATLREGRQAPGVHFDRPQTLLIARLLDELAVDTIECGHPRISHQAGDLVREVARLGLSAPILSHARAHPDDIDAVAATGAAWVGVFLGINDLTRSTRLRDRRVSEVLRMIHAAVAHGRSIGLKVRYTVEDSSRTPHDLLLAAAGAALDAGADRLCYADTVGINEPGDTLEAIDTLHRRFPHAELEVHFHDDRGLAIANSLAAIDAGARWVSTSTNGLGERCGITDLAILLANLHHRGDRPLHNPQAVIRLCDTVAEMTQRPIAPHDPVVGRDAFTHTAKLHRDAVARDPAAYSWIDPATLGRTTHTATAPPDPAHPPPPVNHGPCGRVADPDPTRTGDSHQP